MDEYILAVNKEILFQETVEFTEDIPVRNGRTLRNAKFTKSPVRSVSSQIKKITKNRQYKTQHRTQLHKRTALKVLEKIEKIKKIRRNAAIYYLLLGSDYGQFAYIRSNRAELSNVINKKFSRKVR